MNETATSGRHPVNIGHLVMGLAFAGLLAIWALVEGDLVADDDIRWLLPLPWVLAGGIGLLAVTLAGRRHTETEQLASPHPGNAYSGWVGDTDPTEEPPRH